MDRKEIEVTFKTITPLWTGDAWRKCNELKLTGIVGSLRWWFEALVRGMGYNACNSTENNKCQIEIKKPEDILNIHNKICPVCYLFGATGWKSRFGVRVESEDLKKLYNGKVKVQIKGGKEWHYESGLIGSTNLIFHYEDMVIGGKDDNFVKMNSIFPSILKILLYLITEYGMLGAKTSMGYGVVKFQIKNGNRNEDIQITNNDWQNFMTFLNLFNKHEIKNLPNLKDMFFVKFGVNKDISQIINNMKQFYIYQDGIVEGDVDKWKDDGWIITSPVVRKHIRKTIKENFNDNKLRHFLMGKVAGKNTQFSALQVSHVYKNDNNLEFRIWGWLPDKWPIKGKVNDILQLLTSVFTETPWDGKLPSSIKSDICWKNNALQKLNDMDTFKQLFILKE